ncbi:hypothetical protein PybrP1_011168 [[Pythium] brassicae (nom. inval.)]|nr:hypothetical protein PybrP1_011168 [[Pythium] brassicae (nom. inval.)]
MDGDNYDSTPHMVQAIGACGNPTPSSGNCQFYALAEASIQSSFDTEANINRLVTLTKTIKQVIRAAAMLNFHEEFSDSTRRTPFATMNRATESMIIEDTVAETQAYFNDIASGPHEMADFVARHL